MRGPGVHSREASLPMRDPLILIHLSRLWLGNRGSAHVRGPVCSREGTGPLPLKLTVQWYICLFYRSHTISFLTFHWLKFYDAGKFRSWTPEKKDGIRSDKSGVLNFGKMSSLFTHGNKTFLVMGYENGGKKTRANSK